MKPKLSIKIPLFTLSIVFMIMTEPTAAQYQTPPKTMADVVNAPLTPASWIDPSNTWLLLLERPSLPSIEEVAQKELRPAGLRINPKTNGGSRSYHYTGMRLKSIKNGKEKAIEGLPENPKIENLSWAPNGTKIAFTITKSNGLELWVVDIKQRQATQMTEAIINDAISGTPYRWMADNNTLIYLKLMKTIYGEMKTGPYI